MPYDSTSTDDLMDLLFSTTILSTIAPIKKADKKAETENKNESGKKNPSEEESRNKPLSPKPADDDATDSNNTVQEQPKDIVSGMTSEDMWPGISQSDDQDLKDRVDNLTSLANDTATNLDTISTDEQTKKEQEERRKMDAEGQHQRSTDDLAHIDAPEHTTDELDEMDRKRRRDNAYARAGIVGKSTLLGLIMSDPRDRIGYSMDRAVSTAFDGFSRFVGAMLNGDPMSVASAAWYGTIANLQMFGKGIDSISGRVKRDFKIQDEVDKKKKDMILKERLAIENYKLRHDNIVKIHAGTMNAVYDEMAGYTACLKMFGDPEYARNAIGRTSRQPKWLYNLFGNQAFRAAAAQDEAKFRAYIHKTHHEALIESLAESIPDSDRLQGDGISKFHQIFKAKCGNLDGEGSLLMMMPESALPSIRNDLVDKYVSAVMKRHALENDEDASVESRQLVGDEVAYYQEVLSNLDKYGGGGGGPAYLEAVKQGNAHIANIMSAVTQSEAEYERVYNAESPAFQAIVSKAKVDPAKQRIKTVRYGDALISIVDPGKTIGNKTVRNFVNSELNDLMGQYVGNPAGLNANPKFVSLFNLQSTFDARARLGAKMAFLRKEGLAGNQELINEVTEEYVQSLKEHPWRTFGVQTTLTRGPGVDLTAVEDWQNQVKKRFKPQEEDEKKPSAETPDEKLTGMLTGIFGKDMDRVKLNSASGSKVVGLSAKEGYNALPVKLNFESGATDGAPAIYTDLYDRYKRDTADLTPDERRTLQMLNLLCSGQRRMRALDNLSKAAKDSKLYFGNSETLNSILRNALLHNYTDGWRDWREAVSADYTQSDSVRLVEESDADMSLFGLDASDKKSMIQFLVNDIFHRRPEAFSKYIEKAKSFIKNDKDLTDSISDPDSIDDYCEDLEFIWDGEYYSLYGYDPDDNGKVYDEYLESPSFNFEDIRKNVKIIDALEKASKSVKGGGTFREISDVLSCQFADSTVEFLARIRSQYLAGDNPDDKYREYVKRLGLPEKLIDDLDNALRKNTGLIDDMDPAVYNASISLLGEVLKAMDQNPSKKEDDSVPPKVTEEQINNILNKTKETKQADDPDPPEDDNDLEEDSAETLEEPEDNEELEARKLGHRKDSSWKNDKRTRAYRHAEYFKDALRKGDIRSVYPNGLPKALFDELMDSDLMDVKAKPVIFAGMPAYMTLDRNSNVSYSGLGKIKEFFAKRAVDTVGKTNKDIKLRSQYDKAAKTYDMLSRMVRADRYSRVKASDLGISLEDLCDKLIRKGPFDTVNELQEFMDKYGGSVTADLVADSAIVRGAEANGLTKQAMDLMKEQNKLIRKLTDKIGSIKYGGGSFGNGRALPESDDEKQQEEERPLDVDELNDPYSELSKVVREFNGKVISKPTYVNGQKDKTGLINSQHDAYPLYPNTGGSNSDDKTRRGKVPEKIISYVLSGSEADSKALQEYLYAMESPFLKDGTVSFGFEVPQNSNGKNLHFEAMVALTDYSLDLWEDEIVTSTPYRIAKENGLVDGHGHFVDGDAWTNNPFRLSLKEGFSGVNIHGFSLPNPKYLQGNGKSEDEVLKTNGDVLLSTMTDILSRTGNESRINDPQYKVLIAELKGAVDEFKDSDNLDASTWRSARGRLWNALTACAADRNLSAVQVLDPDGLKTNTFGDIISRELNTEKSILGVGSDGMPSGRVSTSGEVTVNLGAEDQDKYGAAVREYNNSAANKNALYTAIDSMHTLDQKILQIANHFKRYDERYVEENGKHPVYLCKNPTYTRLKYSGSEDDPGTLERVTDLLNGTWQIGTSAAPKSHKKKKRSRRTYESESVFSDRSAMQDITTKTGSAAKVSSLITEYNETTDPNEKYRIIDELVSSIDNSCPNLSKILRSEDHNGKLIDYIRTELGIESLNNMSIEDFVKNHISPKYMPDSGMILDGMKSLFPPNSDGTFKGDQWVKNFLTSGVGVMDTTIPVYAALRLVARMRDADKKYDEGFWNVVDTIAGVKVPGITDKIDIFSDKSADQENIRKYLSAIGNEFVKFMNDPTNVKGTITNKFTGSQVSSAKTALNVDAMFQDRFGARIGPLKEMSPDIKGMFWDYVYNSNNGGISDGAPLPKGSRYISDPAVIGYTVWLAHKLYKANAPTTDMINVNPHAAEIEKVLSKVTNGDSDKGSTSLGARLLVDSFGQCLKSTANPYKMYVAAKLEYNRLLSSELSKFKPSNDGVSTTTLDELRSAVIDARDYALSQLSNASVSPGLVGAKASTDKQSMTVFNPLAAESNRRVFSNMGSNKTESDNKNALGPIYSTYDLNHSTTGSKGSTNGVFSYMPGEYNAADKHIPQYIYDKIKKDAMDGNGDEALVACMIATLGQVDYDSKELSPKGTAASTLWGRDGVKLQVGGGRGINLNNVDVPIYASEDIISVRNLMSDSNINGKKNISLGKFQPVDSDKKPAAAVKEKFNKNPPEYRLSVCKYGDDKYVVIYPMRNVKGSEKTSTENNTFYAKISGDSIGKFENINRFSGGIIVNRSNGTVEMKSYEDLRMGFNGRYGTNIDVKNDATSFNSTENTKVLFYGGKKDIRARKV